MTPSELKVAFRRKEEDRANVPVWMCGKMGSIGGSELALITSCNLRLTAALRAQMKRVPSRTDCCMQVQFPQAFQGLHAITCVPGYSFLLRVSSQTPAHSEDWISNCGNREENSSVAKGQRHYIPPSSY